VSVIIPACDEEETIRAAMESLLAVDYPDLEILAVNDRSTDGTGEILDELAQAHPRLKVLHIEELPEGWLGKVHAMHLGTQATDGAFIIYADADVHFEPDSIARAIAWVEGEQLDHLSLLPRMIWPGIFAGACIVSFAAGWLVAVKVSRINRDKPNAYGGVGAFNLVRRSTLDRTEGWPWLRLEIADDVGLGYLLHRHGAKARLSFAPEALSISWYGSLPEIIRGLEKNMFSCVARFSVLRAAVLSFATCIGPLAPLALLFTPWLWVGVAFLVAGALLSLSAPRLGMRLSAILLATFMGPLLAWIFVRSTFFAVRRGHILWRGTAYDLKELKAHQRVFL
jgi:glycosyltransferase involved in cell wall biosynthesis